MNNRYPHLRFLIDAAPAIAGGAALIVLFGGTLRACQHGGFMGLFSFLLVLLAAVIVYVIGRAKLEFLQAVLDLEDGVRERNEQRHDRVASGDPPKA